MQLLYLSYMTWLYSRGGFWEKQGNRRSQMTDQSTKQTVLDELNQLEGLLARELAKLQAMFPD